MHGNTEDSTYLVNHARADMGLSSITGGPGLHATQQYPEGYGETVCQQWEDWYKSKTAVVELEASESESSDEECEPCADRWVDAKLDGVAKLLRVPDDRLVI